MFKLILFLITKFLKLIIFILEGLVLIKQGLIKYFIVSVNAGIIVSRLVTGCHLGDNNCPLEVLGKQKEGKWQDRSSFRAYLGIVIGVIFGIAMWIVPVLAIIHFIF
jgi:hypothetical protein